MISLKFFNQLRVKDVKSQTIEKYHIILHSKQNNHRVAPLEIYLLNSNPNDSQNGDFEPIMEQE